MPRLAFALLTAVAVAADPAPDVAALVRQLAHPDFDRREAAQAALVALGPASLPALDALEPFADPETAHRVRAVRRAVGGVAFDLREMLEAAAPHLPEPYTRRPLSPANHALIAGHQPAAGDFLLTLVGDRKHPLHRAAVNAFVQARPAMSADQTRAYLERTADLTAPRRPAYPRGVDAMFPLEYGFRHGWDTGQPGYTRFMAATVTTHTLDGKPYGSPFRYADDSSGATTGWVRTKDLAVGRHAVSFATRFEATHNGKPLTVTVRSPEFAFEVLPADTPDDLIAPADPAVEKRVRAALTTTETRDPPDGGPAAGNLFRLPADDWRPQITWVEKDGTRNGLHAPVWRLAGPLPVDLAFAVSLRAADGAEFPADPLVAVKGKTGLRGVFLPRDVDAFAKGRSGFVPVQVVLRPSRAVALTDLRVTRYYPGEIVSPPLRVKVGPEESGPKVLGGMVR